MASGIDVVSIFVAACLPKPVLGTNPGETATIAFVALSFRFHQCAPRSCMNFVVPYTEARFAPDASRTMISSVPDSYQ